MKQKRKSRGRVFLSLIAGALLLCLASCSDDWTKTESTWTFEHYAAGVNYIDVTPRGDADCDTFRLYFGQTKKVTWEDEGDNYYSYEASPSNGSIRAEKYDSLREIVFYAK
ncbi:MAG: hypothetical protein J6K96_03825 [Treponema sp.]|nr:hypothetical protein [Treponema sp.]